MFYWRCVHTIIVALVTILFLDGCHSYGSTQHRTDRTLEANCTGASVVRAVIRKIYASEVFSSSHWWHEAGQKTLIEVFLRRVAYVETQDGVHYSKGGIWNVSMEMFTSTQMPQPGDHLQYIMNKTRMGIVDWGTITYDDMKVPMYSGLAIVLRLDQLIYTNPDYLFLRPDNHAKEVNLWCNLFYELQDSSGCTRSEILWVRQAVDHLREIERCSIKSDIVFLLDSSISISDAHFMSEKEFVKSFINQLVQPGNMSSTVTYRIGVIVVGDEATVHLELREILNMTNKDQILNEVNQTSRRRWQFTNIADGLCILKQQRWREDNSGVLKLAVVLTDGMSNTRSQTCDEANTKEMIDSIHNETHILVYAIGIGSRLNHDELRLIGSKNNLTTDLGEDWDEQLTFMDNVLYHQICSTLAAETQPEEVENGILARNEIMRWVLKDHGEGLTVRFCINKGNLTFYVSRVATANDAFNDQTSTITADTLKLNCTTLFSPYPRWPHRGRRQLESHTSTLYISVIGHEDINSFSLESGYGIVNFDVDECKQSPSPCDSTATCRNTDGSFYCEYMERESQFKYKWYLFQVLAFLVPSTVLGGLLLFSCILLLPLTLCCMKYRKCGFRHKSVKRVDATNLMALTQS